ncbi:MAG: hypothetical protein ACJAUD_000055 [Crocinitomicaceae bacterium]|jgi:hypothetical protein
MVKLKNKIIAWCFVFVVAPVFGQINSELVFGTCLSESYPDIAVDPVNKHQYVVNRSAPEFHDRTVVTKMTESRDIVWSKMIYLDSSWQGITASSITWLDTSLVITGIMEHFEPTTGYYQKKTFVAHMNTNGDIIWMKHIHDVGIMLNPKPASVTFLNNQIIVSSSTKSFFSYNDKVMIITALSTDGVVLWSKTIDAPGRINAVVASPDGNIVAAGTIPDSFTGNSSYYQGSPFLIKLDNFGNIIWAAKYLRDTIAYSHIDPMSIDFIQSDSSIIMVGKIGIGFPLVSTLAYAGRFSLQTGAVIWSKEITSGIQSNLAEVIVADNSVFLAGICNSNVSGDICLTKVQESGIVDWTYTYGDPLEHDLVYNGVYYNADIVLVGVKNINQQPWSGNDLYHLTIRTSGEASNKLDTLNTTLTDLIHTIDTTLTLSPGYSLDSVVIFHDSLVDYNLDTIACMPVGINTIDLSTEPILLFPNPANDIVSIQVPLIIKNELLEITLINSMGQEILRTNSTTFSIKFLSKGMYFVRVNSKLYQWNQKLQVF